MRFSREFPLGRWRGRFSVSGFGQRSGRAPAVIASSNDNNAATNPDGACARVPLHGRALCATLPRFVKARARYSALAFRGPGAIDPQLLRIDPIIARMVHSCIGSTPASGTSGRHAPDTLRGTDARDAARRAACASAAAIAVAGVAAAGPALAQGWWPWSAARARAPPPVPREPVFRPAAAQHAARRSPATAQPPPAGQRRRAAAVPPTGRPATRSACSSSSGSCRRASAPTSHATCYPRSRREMRQARCRPYQHSDHELERADCWDQFLFSKTLRRTRSCVDLAQPDGKQRASGSADLDAQRQQIMGTSERSYQRRHRARAGAQQLRRQQYTQEARRQRSRQPFSSIWQDEESGGARRGPPTSSATCPSPPTARLRAAVRRLLLPGQLLDAAEPLPAGREPCQSKCAAPVELYYHQNPGAAVDQWSRRHTQEPYTSLKSAFRYRKEFVQGCSCKEAEYTPPEGEQTGKRADTDATTGWEARSEPEAKSR